VLVTGGAGAGGASLSSAEVWDPSTGSWSAIPPMRAARAFHAAVTLQDGRVFAFGGGPTTTEALTFDDDVAPFVSPNMSYTTYVASGPVAIASYFSDEVSGVDRAEYFLGTDPGLGSATPLALQPFFGSVVQGTATVAASSLGEGSHRLGLRAMDHAGNWSATKELAIVVDRSAPVVRARLEPSVSQQGYWSRLVVDTEDASFVVAAEYFLGADPGVGSGTAIPFVPADTRWRTLEAYLGADLPVGSYEVHARAQDVAGNWSGVTTVTLTVEPPDVAPPVVDVLSVSQPVVAVGDSAYVYVRATDAQTGVVRMAWALDGEAESGVRHSVPAYLDNRSASASFSIGTGGLTLGLHRVTVYAADPFGNEGSASAGFEVRPVDHDRPRVTSLTMNPSTIVLGQSSTAYAQLIDDTTRITRAELFLDSDPGVGAGRTVAIGVSGLTASISEPVGPGLAPGTHVVGVRAMDLAGNWSETVTANLVVVLPDITAPVVESVRVTSDVVNIGAEVSFAGDATDDRAGVVAAERFVDADPGVGLATPIAVAPSGTAASFSGSLPTDLATGEHVVGVRVRDAAGNWSATSTATFVVVDRSAPQVTGSGALTSIDASAVRVTFGFDVRYRDRVTLPQGTLTVKTPTLSLKLAEYRWLAVGASKTSLLAVALDKDRGVWWVRLDADSTADVLTVRLYRSAEGPTGAPTLTATGRVSGQLTVHK
jgi:hypothetical protein